jgi:opacity protein-like surface antigen
MTMIRSLLLVLILVAAPVLAQAQEGSPGAEHKWSVGTGLGFAASIGSGPLSQSGFNWQLDGQYRITDSISAGIWMQVVPVTLATVFAMAGDARYHFGFLRGNSNEFVSKLTPYAGAGMGLWHIGADVGNLSDNAFLFSMIAGMEYDLTDHFALTSDMRFNILGGTAPAINDSFYFSWQIIGARYRF